ncbi:adenosylcobinamide kinase /adenosylcobinamide-phosphate guanylyltransferase [Salsuginibacillus halophilus]|uniref:Adenosylcobinamide kinase n=1 Tax=Salsuginibacillus halophilus TaxID=517424 RepID=A0A2P8HL27_9BACI|nr:bifunctional adenosylcobinamide kinase/adenosylcobinamide-phosphate guanylyltransferase [Salsuginibacillus halophilus]PSL46922.1 adenosylcobinamide kinase /adenosylcobinamide-phosphate guanylyltransferase [Salsuginibacillus halophilus]
MQLVVGGAWSGKRNIAASLAEADGIWLHAEEDQLNAKEQKTMIVDGWDVWVQARIACGSTPEQVRLQFREKLKELKAIKSRQVILIMEEAGRGIVPLEQADRFFRDANGWMAQDAAHEAEEVHHVWHGLCRQLK